MRKTILLVMMTLVLVGIIQMIPPESQHTVRADPPPPSDDVNGTYVQYIQGDWTVTGSENYTDEIIVLDGNLTVKNGGVLTLRNVTLSMNCTSSDGQYIIKVENGGTLIISDKDFDPSTPEDMTNLTDAEGDVDDGGASDYEYCIQIWDGATFKMNNTNVREMGYSGSNSHGLMVDTDYADIQNCTFSNGFWGTMFWSNFNTIAYNTYYNCTTGLQLSTSCGYNQVYNNTASRCDNGIYIGGSYHTIFNNYAHNCTQIFNLDVQRQGGMKLQSLQYSEVYNNRLEYCGGYWYQANLVVQQCNDLYIHDNDIRNAKSLSYGLYSTWGKNLNYSYNEVRDGLYMGFYVYMGNGDGNIKLYRNNITGNNNDGLYVRGVTSTDNYVEVIDNELWGNSDGITLSELVAYNICDNFVNGSSRGCDATDVSGGLFANNTIMNCGNHFYIREADSPYGDMLFNITNCDFNQSRITFYTSTGNPAVAIQNFLSVKAIDEVGVVPMATITIENGTGDVIFNETTDINGQLWYIPITNQTRWVEGPSTENVTYHDSHNITGYYMGDTGYCSIEPVMNVSQNVTVLFYTDLKPLPPSALTAVNQGKDVFLNWSPSISPDIDHYLVFRNDTLGGWELVYNSSNNPGNETVTNWADINGASDWSTYRYNVTAVDTGGQQSDFTNIARCGEWFIDDPRTVADKTIIMNGSITILSSGDLILQNVTLIFNCTSSLEFGLDVESGATLIITDNDNDPLTTHDRSDITSFNSSYKYLFDMRGSDLTIKNSRLSDCGSCNIESENVSIENNEFYSCQDGVKLNSVSNANIIGNKFTECSIGIYIVGGSNNTITNNEIYDYDWQGITLRNTNNNTVNNIIIVNQVKGDEAIYLYGGGCYNNTITNITISNAYSGIYLDTDGGNNMFYNFTINDTNNGVYVRNSQMSYFYNISVNNTFNRAFYIYNSAFITVLNATIDKSYEGFHFQSADNVVISDIDVLNVTEGAIEAYWSSDLSFHNMTIKSQQYGAYFDDCDEIYMDNVVIKNCSYGIVAEKWWNSPEVFFQIRDCDILNATIDAIYLDTIDEFYAYDCSFMGGNKQVNATVVDFSGIDGVIKFFNCTFNESQLDLDTECILHVYWRLYLYVEHWGGGPCANTDVKIKDAYGTIAYQGTTGANGWAGNVYLRDRVYYATYNISYNPHIIDANFGFHTGSKQVFMNVSQATTIVLGNKLPIASAVLIIPQGATTTDDLNMSYSYNDPDLDTEGLTIIRWYVDGTLEPSFDNLTIINSSYTSKGQTWTCEVTPHDGVAYGNPTNSIPVTIKNTAPVATDVQITEINPTSSDELHITYTFYDIDGDGDTRTLRQWWYNDSSGWTYSGVDSTKLSESYTTKGEQWKCIITPGDWENYGNPVESNVVYINNSPPIIKDAKIEPNSPLSSDALQALYVYFDVDSDPESGSTIRWYKNDVEQWNLNDSISVDASFTQKDETWYYTVTPRDGIDFGPPWQSGSVTLKNTPPSVTNITISPPDPNTENELTCDYDFHDYDGDPESLDTVVRWLRWNGVEFFDTGLRGKTLPPGHTSKGEVWMCQVIPHDGYNEGIPTLSEMNVTILNSAPSILGADIQPQNPDSVTDLQAGYQYNDPDSDPENGSIIQWYMNAVEQVDLNGSFAVSSSRTVKGDIWYFIITPSDGEVFGTPVQSASVTIGNTPPSVSNILISPVSPDTEDDLTVSYDFFDVDGDGESLDTVVKWLRWTGVDFFDTGHRGKTLSSDHTSKGETWMCEVIPHDGEDEGVVSQSDMNVTIINSAPSIVSADITPANPTSLSNISASYIYYDVDSDAENGSLISWYRNGIEQVSLFGNFTINGSETLKGDTWFYIVTPYDGEEFGLPFVSASMVIGNAPPSVSNIIITPSNPDTENVLTASYDYYDPDGDLESLDTVVKWLRWSGSDFFDTGHRGKTLSSEHTSKGEIWMCEVVPHDGEDEGTVNSSTMNVTIINSAPSVLSADITPANPTSLSNISASYDYYDVDTDAENGSLISWYRNGMEQVGLSGYYTFNSSYTLKGELWYYIITPSDGEEFGLPFVSDSVVIGNTPPTVSNITIAPLNPDTEDDLTVSYDYYDTDGDPESLDTVVKWLRWSGSDFFDTGHRGKTLSSDNTAKGDRWTCEVVPHDGTSEGSAIPCDMNVTIGNSPPSVISAQITPSSPSSVSDLVASYVYWDIDSDTESGSLISWYRDGIVQTDLTGNFSVNFSKTLRGESWYYIITPSDGENFGTPVQSSTIEIGNTPPTVSNITVSPLNPDTKNDLTVSYDYYDMDGDLESLDTVVKWMRWSGSDFFDTGHRGKTLSSANTARGEIWTCEVVPHDGTDEGTAIPCDMNVTIGNSAPSVLSATITPSSPIAVDDIATNYDYYDIDSDPESGSTISWFRNGVEQTGLAGGTTVNSVYTQKGDTWYYVVTPSDGEDYGTPVQSLTITIGNTPPQVSNIAISPLSPTTRDDLSVTYDYSDTDGDLESLDTTVKWLRWSGIDFIDTGYRGKTLASTHTSKDEIWTCEVIPHDGGDEGSATQSGMDVTILNSAPEVIKALVAPADPTSDQHLSADYGYLDVDSDPESGSMIRWFRNGVEQTDLNDSLSVNASRTHKGDVWYYIVTPYDGEDYGTPVQSAFTVVGNAPPQVSNIAISPLDPTTQSDLSVAYDFFDSDGDTEGLDTIIRWLRWSGSNFVDTGLRGKTLPNSNTQKGDLWTCEVIPHDGVEPGNKVLSDNTVTILNSRPSVSDIGITPDDPTTAQDLFPYYEYTDPDGDPELGSEIRWFRNGQHVGALDDQFKVPSSMTAKGQLWNFSLHPCDNYEYGDWVDSESITIQNNPPYTMNLTITPNPPLGDESFTAHYTFKDVDGDTEQGYTIKWYKNGIHQTLFDDSLKVDSTASGKGELWYFSLRVYDGEDWSAETSSHYVAIQNSKPVVSSLQQATGQIVLNEMETVEFQVDADDPDGDLLLYKWRLDKTSVSDDVYYLFAPDYDGAGTYTLNLTIQDVGGKSYTLAYEWDIVVNNVNRNPELDVLEPLVKDPKMKEDTSLRFRIDESDPDTGDTLDITWYFDDVVAQEGGSSYTYHADFAAAGDHVVKAVVADGTDSVEYSWNLTVENVEEIGRETLLGQSYDWWGLVLAILSGVAALLLALIGLMRVRRKKGALKKYMAEIDELSKDRTLSPEEFEEKLSDIEARINDEFRQGMIEDLHYLMLQDLIASKRGEARKAEVTSKFGRLPSGIVQDLDNMLKDGKITPEEYEGFVATISMTESLTPEEKDELSKVIEKWGAEDDDITSQDSQEVKDTIIKDELDEIMDDRE